MIGRHANATTWQTPKMSRERDVSDSTSVCLDSLLIIDGYIFVASNSLKVCFPNVHEKSRLLLILTLGTITR